MTFKRFACWDKDMAARVMNTEALDIPDYHFLATHHPVKMYQLDLARDKQDSVYDEKSFLKDFFNTPDYNFVAVLGESGTGKSHLVRWLHANIPDQDDRKVLLIRKARTNLKEIIKDILKGLEGDIFDEYRRRLEKNTENITPGQAREKLLHALIEAVGPQATHHVGLTEDGVLSEEQEYIREELPNLLSDPLFREKLLKEEGVIHQLTTHIMGYSEEIERREERREFASEDLPLNIRDINKAGEAARDFYSTIVGDEELKALTVEWLNLNLDTAINQVMAFRGEDMFNLMLEVREALAEKDQELILLIEDFAKLQGIDLQLLEALLVRQNMGNRKLCKLRVALASTRGYFNKLEKTVITRIGFGVTLDINVEGATKIFHEQDVIDFTARYLNAVRLKDSDLKKWLNSGDVDGGGERELLPNACQDCPHRDPCHQSYGASEELGMGLYPFNRRAVLNMLEHVSPKQFNPRLFIDRALKHTLYNYKEKLEEGLFPPFTLLEHFTQPAMSALDIRQLREKDTVDYRRRQAFLELWGKGIVENLAEGMHQAFDLPTLNIKGGTSPPEQKERDTVEKEKEKIVKTKKEKGIPAKITAKIRELDQWQNEDALSQDLSDELRRNVYAAVSEGIDWDSQLMLRKEFQGTKKIFKRVSITFEKQSTKARVGVGLHDVGLNIPLEGESLTDSALALQAIIYFQHYRHWVFANGPYYLRVYSRELEKWKRHVLQQVRRGAEDEPDWNPVPALVELLALGGRMAGLWKDPAILEENVQALFEDMPPLKPESDRSKQWKELYNLLKNKREQQEGSLINGLRETLLSRTACTKGGISTLQLVDAASFLKPLSELEKNWYPKATIPEKPIINYEIIAKTRKGLDNKISLAMKGELQRCQEWLTLMNDTFGQHSQNEIVTLLKETAREASTAGVMVVREDKMNATIQEFENSRYDEVLGYVKAVLEEKEWGPLSGLLGTLDDYSMSVGEKMASTTVSFTKGTLQKVINNIETLGREEDPQGVQKKIDEHLAQLESCLNRLEGGLVHVSK